MSTYLLDDVLGYLAGAGLALTSGTNLFASMLPESPDQAVAMFEYQGQKPQFTMGPATLPAFTMPHLQVMVRDPSFTAGRATAFGCYNALNAVVNQVLNGTYYERIESDQEPYLLHRDSSRRCYFVANFTVWRTPS